MSNSSALTQLARGTGALEAEIESLEWEASKNGCAYRRAIAGKKVTAMKEALANADKLLDQLLAIHEL